MIHGVTGLPLAAIRAQSDRVHTQRHCRQKHVSPVHSCTRLTLPVSIFFFNYNFFFSFEETIECLFSYSYFTDCTRIGLHVLMLKRTLFFFSYYPLLQHPVFEMLHFSPVLPEAPLLKSLVCSNWSATHRLAQAPPTMCMVSSAFIFQLQASCTATENIRIRTDFKLKLHHHACKGRYLNRIGLRLTASVVGCEEASYRVLIKDKQANVFLQVVHFMPSFCSGHVNKVNIQTAVTHTVARILQHPLR